MVALRALLALGAALLLAMPLIYSPATLFPFMVGKALYARALVELLVALWVGLWLWGEGCRPPRSWVLAAFLAYLVLAFVSALYGVSPTRSLWSNYERMMGVWDLLHWFLLTVVLSSVLRRPGQWHALLNGNLAVVLLLSLIAIAQVWGTPLPSYLRSEERVDATLGNPSYLAAILVVAIPLAVGFLVRSFLANGSGWAARRGAQWGNLRLALRVLWAGGAAMALWVLFQTGTRGALAGLLVGTVVMPVALLVWGNRQALRPVALGSAAILLATGVLFLLDTAGRFPTPSAPIPGAERHLTSQRLMDTRIEEGSVSIRLTAVRVGLRAVAERPVLGWGPENYGAAFDQHVGAAFFKDRSVYLDQAHNQVVEELVTKGVLGELTYLGLWGTLVWGILRRRRTPTEEVLAYTVLGALVAYFVQNLFLFDTPPMRLQWSLLVAWVVAQEGPGDPVRDVPPASRRRRSASRAAPGPGRIGAMVLVFVLIAASVYWFNYRPYTAARDFEQAMADGGPQVQQIGRAKRSFRAFPQLATLPRAMLFTRVTQRWEEAGPQERSQVLVLLPLEGDLAIAAEPMNSRVLVSIISFLQTAAPSREALTGVDPLLAQLRRVAPERLETHLLLARQAFLRGDDEKACEFVTAYVARAPQAARHFVELQQAIGEEVPGGCR